MLFEDILRYSSSVHYADYIYALGDSIQLAKFSSWIIHRFVNPKRSLIFLQLSCNDKYIIANILVQQNRKKANEMQWMHAAGRQMIIIYSSICKQNVLIVHFIKCTTSPYFQWKYFQPASNHRPTFDPASLLLLSKKKKEKNKK